MNLSNFCLIFNSKKDSNLEKYIYKKKTKLNMHWEIKEDAVKRKLVKIKKKKQI